MTLGHEIAGVIVEVGASVSGWKTGDAVVCAAAPAGMALPKPGNDADGGFAELCVVSAAKLMPIPPGVSFAAAAVATDALNTSYAAVRTTAAVEPAETIGIVGLGGLGIGGIQAAIEVTDEVYGVDINPAARAAGLEAGARRCFVTVGELAEVAPDVIVDFAGAGSTTEDAIGAAGFGGRVVLVGMTNRSVEVSVFDLILGQKRLIGSHGGTRDSLAKVLEGLAAGRFVPNIELISLAEVNDGLRRLAANESSGMRLVAQPNA